MEPGKYIQSNLPAYVFRTIVRLQSNRDEEVIRPCIVRSSCFAMRKRRILQSLLGELILYLLATEGSVRDIVVVMTYPHHMPSASLWRQDLHAARLAH